MTKDEMNYITNQLDITTDEWVSPPEKLAQIVLTTNECIMINPKVHKIYIDMKKQDLKLDTVGYYGLPNVEIGIVKGKFAKYAFSAIGGFLMTNSHLHGGIIQ